MPLTSNSLLLFCWKFWQTWRHNNIIKWRQWQRWRHKIWLQNVIIELIFSIKNLLLLLCWKFWQTWRPNYVNKWRNYATQVVYPMIETINRLRYQWGTPPIWAIFCLPSYIFDKNDVILRHGMPKLSRLQKQKNKIIKSSVGPASLFTTKKLSLTTWWSWSITLGAVCRSFPSPSFWLPFGNCYTHPWKDLW